MDGLSSELVRPLLGLVVGIGLAHDERHVDGVDVAAEVESVVISVA